jgi:hypothetical protein
LKNQTKYIDELFSNPNGTVLAGRLKDQRRRKPRRYKAPDGYNVTFERILFHPITHKHLGCWQYWLILAAVIEPIDKIIAGLYLDEFSNDEALRKLVMLDPRILAEKLLDCFSRGDCRSLFCDEEGVPHQTWFDRIPNLYPTHY